LSVEFDVKACCEALDVSRSGFYPWQNPEPGQQRAQADAALLERIVEVFNQHKQRYGSPRVTQALHQAGVRCGENRVARLMREHELVARPKRPFGPRTTRAGERVAPNRIQDLEPSGLDQIWVSDITYVATQEGWLYLAMILDLFSRKVVGWKLGETLEAELVVTALQNALSRREPPRGLIFHSDSRLPVQQRGGPQTAHLIGPAAEHERAG
jgi:putative transposase